MRFDQRLVEIESEIARAWTLLGEAEKRGEKLPVIDSLIAVSASVHDLVVVTRNVQDMARCQAKVFNPWESQPGINKIIRRIMSDTRLPINIDALLKGHTVESERLEFKKGWNPESVIHTFCAFANDFHNLGGGYIVIGIEERDGLPILPPAGIPANRIDKIQKEILALGYRIQPAYHPVIASYVIQDRHVLILWAPGGQTRPYKAPVSLAKAAREFAYYIRKASATVRTAPNDEMELLSLTATVPFDDRIAHQASLDDLDLALIRDFLREVGSKLYGDASGMDFTQLCRQMDIVAGPEEMLRPLNVGLLFFNEVPDRFFPRPRLTSSSSPTDRAAMSSAKRFSKALLTAWSRRPLLISTRFSLKRSSLSSGGYPRRSASSTTPMKPWKRPSSTRFTTAAMRSGSPSRSAFFLMASRSPATPARTDPSTLMTSAPAGG